MTWWRRIPAAIDPGPRVDGPTPRGDGRLRRPGRRGVRLRQQPAAEAELGGFERAFAYPGFPPAYIRPLFCEGKGPFRWAALSGDPADIGATDKAVLDLISEVEPPAPIHLPDQARPGPARPHLLARLRRAPPDGLRFNELVAAGKVQAPIVIGRDHLDLSVASPYRETEAMRDGLDAIADWPLLNALLSTASGASWVSLHHGGGVGIGRSIHVGMVVVADGSELAAQKLERVLTNDPGSGVARHADAGYPEALRVARASGCSCPCSRDHLLGRPLSCRTG